MAFSCAQNKLSEGAIGARIEVTLYTDCTQTTPQDLTGATVLFTFVKTDRSTQAVSATLDADPTTGKASYVTQAGDIDQAGLWRLRVQYTLASGLVSYDAGDMTLDIERSP